MAETVTKVPVKKETGEAASPTMPGWWPFDPPWRVHVDRMIDQFPYRLWRAPALAMLRDFEPVWRADWAPGIVPAVDVIETDHAYEIMADLPGINEKNIEVKYAHGMLTIKGDKEVAKSAARKDYHLSERRFGSFRRSFRVPRGVDIE
jgi:HSP20 family protein